jgi:hypothetical protein
MPFELHPSFPGPVHGGAGIGSHRDRRCWDGHGQSSGDGSTHYPLQLMEGQSQERTALDAAFHDGQKRLGAAASGNVIRPESSRTTAHDIAPIPSTGSHPGAKLATHVTPKELLGGVFVRKR